MKSLAWILCLGAGCLLSAGCSNSTTTGSGKADAGRSGDSKAAEEERARKSIERVLAADKGTTAGATSVAQVVNRMRAIDTAGCPNDFRAAYLAHIHAWEMMADVEKDAIALKADSESGATLVESFIRGFLGDPFGKANEIQAAQTQLQRNYQAANQQIKSTFHRVEEVAVLHGVTLPPRDSVSQIRQEDLRLFPVITSVDAGSIASSVGIQSGDILLEYDGVPLHTETRSNDELRRAISAAAGRSGVEVKLYRGGSLVTVAVPGGRLLGIKYNVSR
jgi:hypothetical protein